MPTRRERKSCARPLTKDIRGYCAAWRYTAHYAAHRPLMRPTTCRLPARPPRQTSQPPLISIKTEPDQPLKIMPTAGRELRPPELLAGAVVAAGGGGKPMTEVAIKPNGIQK